MFPVNFILAWRNILRKKTLVFINLASLSMGLTCAIIIAIFVSYEQLSLDRHYTKSEKTFEVAEATPFTESVT